MEKKIILEKLQATLAKMKELPEEKFNYAQFISEFDFEKKCGSVCCIAGWYPVWFPEAGLRYNKSGMLIAGEDNSGIGFKIPRYLEEWHGLDFAYIDALFFGATPIMIRRRRISFDATLDQVIAFWEAIIDHIEKNISLT